MAAFNQEDAELAIGAPRYTSTPLPKRRPAAPTLPALSLPEYVPTVSAVNPMASPSLIQPYYSTYATPYFFPPTSSMYSTYRPIANYILPPSPGILAQHMVSNIFQAQLPSRPAESPLFCPPPIQISPPAPRSPVTESRPDFFLPICSSEKPDISKAIDDLIAQVLGPEMKPSSPTLVASSRQASLESRLRAMQTRFPSESKELLSFLTFHCSSIEKEQQQCLSDGLFQADYNNWLKQRYAEQLHRVYQTVEKRLQVLENQTKKTRQQRILNQEAVTLMEKWFQQHTTNPYPTMEEAEDMANQGGITVTQLRKWFANKRHRSRHTRSDRPAPQMTVFM